MSDETQDNAVVVPERHVTRLPALPQEMSIDQVEARVGKVRELQSRIMKDGVHYGVIPGTPKPTLLKGGAELMCLTFMLDPQYEHEIKQDGVNREIISRCVLYHIPTSNRVASGEGSCSTYESKYQYRKVEPECPKCHKMLRHSKNNPEWYCWAKMGGCGATYPLSDTRIKSGGRVVNPDIPDQYNTVLKMANKRSLVAAILNATAASEIFTQDVEDMQGEDNDIEVGGADQRPVAGKTDGSPSAASPAKFPSQTEARVSVEADKRADNSPTAAPSSRQTDDPKAMSQGQGRHMMALLRDAELWNGDNPTAAREWLRNEVGVEIVHTEGKTPEENCIAQIRAIGGGDTFSAVVRKLNPLAEAGRQRRKEREALAKEQQ